MKPIEDYTLDELSAKIESIKAEFSLKPADDWKTSLMECGV